MTTRPLLCIVTDRRRLAEAHGRPLADGCGLVLRQVEAAVTARVPIVQIRERDLAGGDLFRLVGDAVRISSGSATRVVVNDRLDVAIAAGAAGVHLRERSITAADARRIAPGFLIGRSVHTARAAAESGPVDYLIAGTVFPTGAKPGVNPIGLDGFAEIVGAAGRTPVLAIGGVTPDAVQRLVAAGAAGVAAVGAFIPGRRSEDLGLAVRQTVDALRLAFDAGSTSPGPLE